MRDDRDVARLFLMPLREEGYESRWPGGVLLARLPQALQAPVSNTFFQLTCTIGWRGCRLAPRTRPWYTTTSALIPQHVNVRRETGECGDCPCIYRAPTCGSKRQRATRPRRRTCKWQCACALTPCPHQHMNQNGMLAVPVSNSRHQCWLPDTQPGARPAFIPARNTPSHPSTLSPHPPLRQRDAILQPEHSATHCQPPRIQAVPASCNATPMSRPSHLLALTQLLALSLKVIYIFMLSYSLSTSWYLAMACSARMRRAVSVATPTLRMREGVMGVGRGVTVRWGAGWFAHAGPLQPRFSNPVAHAVPRPERRYPSSSSTTSRRSRATRAQQPCERIPFHALSLTMMSTEVPAKPRKAVRCVIASTAAGAALRAPRNTEPSSDMRVSVRVTYSAVCLPGRMAGMAAPVFFSCSAKSLGSSYAEVEWGQGVRRREGGSREEIDVVVNT